MSDTRRPGNRKEDWIGLHLRRVYDDAVHDSIPTEMLDLLSALDEDRAAEAKDEPEKDGKA